MFKGPYFPLRTACLISYGKDKMFLSSYYYLINVVNIKITNYNVQCPLQNNIVPL